MSAPINHFKSALQTGKLQRGIWLTLGSAVVAEIAGQSGFDWCLIDGEHAPYDPTAIRTQLIALDATGTAAIVRVPTNADWLLKQVLDLGAQTVLVPMVDTAADAAAAVAACRYPPFGRRGMGPAIARSGRFGATQGYPETANAQICVIVQAESRAALENLDDICAVDGVDAVFIGPADLASDMGYIHDMGNPVVLNAIDAAIATIRAHGKPAGIITFDPAEQARYAAGGITILGLGADAHVLAGSLRALGSPE